MASRQVLAHDTNPPNDRQTPAPTDIGGFRQGKATHGESRQQLAQRTATEKGLLIQKRTRDRLTLGLPTSRFGGSNLHQRDSRSALFEGYKGGADSTRRQYSASPASVGGGYGYGYGGGSGGGYPGSNGSGGQLGVPENRGFRPATPNSRGQYDTATLDELESQNDSEVSGILSKVKVLKTLTVAMGDEIRDSSAMMDKMNDTFDNTRLRLRGTMNRMLVMAEKTGVGWRVWLGFFAAVVLIFMYVWLF